MSNGTLRGLDPAKTSTPAASAREHRGRFAPAGGNDSGVSDTRAPDTSVPDTVVPARSSSRFEAASSNSPSPTFASRPVSTASTARAAEASTLDAIRIRFGLDASAVAQLQAFVSFQGVPESRLVRVGTNERFQGPEKTVAMQVFATLYDAAHHAKMRPERARALVDHVLPALEHGAIGVRLHDSDEFDAAYNGRNAGTKRGLEPNTVYFPKSGIDLGLRSTRGLIVHEADHIAADAIRELRSFGASEYSAYRTHADYLLRDSGALVPDGDGFRLNHAAFQAMQASELSVPVRKLVFEVFAEAAQRNADAGRAAQNDLYAELGHKVGPFIAEQSGWPGAFEDVYAGFLQRNKLRFARVSLDDIKRMLARPAPADGL